MERVEGRFPGTIFPLKELKINDEISTHRQIKTETIHNTWLRIIQKLNKCPNHYLTEMHLKQTFYRSLNNVTKPIIDAIFRGSLMRGPFAESMQPLDEVSKNNTTWYSREAEVGALRYVPIRSFS